MLEFMELDRQNAAMWNGLTNKHATGCYRRFGESVYIFALIIRSLYCTCSEAMIWIFAVG